ncbi:R3 protein [Beet curly top virus]|uniref:R3 protein n=1 Tax=Beet curly top virus TaxID=10840 RepID=A5HDX2_9GEMI|nr:R3 protein [Beet curly top virus]
MMVCIPDWLFLIFIFSIIIQAGTNVYGTLQSGSISRQLSKISCRCDELFVKLQQILYPRSASREQTPDHRRRRGLSAIPEGREEASEA